MPDYAHPDTSPDARFTIVPIAKIGTYTLAPDATGPAVTVAVLDTETTSLNASEAEIIELAITLYDAERATGRPVADTERTVSWLQEPSRPPSPESTRVTGLTMADLAGQRIDYQAVADIAGRADWFIAHAARFDRPVFERHAGLAGHRWGCSQTDIDWEGRRVFGRTLGALCASHGFWFNPHRAAADTVALARLLQRDDPLDRDRALLATLLDRAERVDHHVGLQTGRYPGEDLLNALKGARWRFDPETKIWHTACPTPERAEALARVLPGRAEELADRPISTDVCHATVDARTRHTDVFDWSFEGPRARAPDAGE